MFRLRDSPLFTSIQTGAGFVGQVFEMIVLPSEHCIPVDRVCLGILHIRVVLHALERKLGGRSFESKPKDHDTVHVLKINVARTRPANTSIRLTL